MRKNNLWDIKDIMSMTDFDFNSKESRKMGRSWLTYSPEFNTRGEAQKMEGNSESAVFISSYSRNYKETDSFDEIQSVLDSEYSLFDKRRDARCDYDIECEDLISTDSSLPDEDFASWKQSTYDLGYLLSLKLQMDKLGGFDWAALRRELEAEACITDSVAAEYSGTETEYSGTETEDEVETETEEEYPTEIEASCATETEESSVADAEECSIESEYFDDLETDDESSDAIIEDMLYPASYSNLNSIEIDSVSDKLSILAEPDLSDISVTSEVSDLYWVSKSEVSEYFNQEEDSSKEGLLEASDLVETEYEVDNNSVRRPCDLVQEEALNSEEFIAAHEEEDCSGLDEYYPSEDLAASQEVNDSDFVCSDCASDLHDQSTIRITYTNSNDVSEVVIQCDDPVEVSVHVDVAAEITSNSYSLN